MIKKLIGKLLDIHPDSISFKQAMDLTDLPIVTMFQGENKFNLLLDTGSTDNVIDSNVLSNIVHERIDYKGTLTGLDGIKSDVSACNISFSYGEREYPYTYLVRDMKPAFDMMKQDYGVTLHGIIGSKFFNKYRYVLDFASLIAYSKK